MTLTWFKWKRTPNFYGLLKKAELYMKFYSESEILWSEMSELWWTGWQFLGCLVQFLTIFWYLGHLELKNRSSYDFVNVRKVGYSNKLRIKLSLVWFIFKNDLTYFFQVFGGSVHQKVSKDLETAVNLGWTAAKNETR